MKKLIVLVAAALLLEAGNATFTYEVDYPLYQIWSPCTAEMIDLSGSWIVNVKYLVGPDGVTTNFHETVHETMAGVGELSGFTYTATGDWVVNGKVDQNASFDIRTVLSSAGHIAPDLMIHQIAHFAIDGNGAFQVVVDKTEVVCK